VKAAIQAALSRIPAGDLVYRKLQDVGGSSRFDLEDQYCRKLAFIGRMREHGIAIRHGRFLEIGTGWHPVFPVLLMLLGAREVHTIDINPWMTSESLLDMLTELTKQSDRVAKDFELDPEETRAYFITFLARASAANSLDEALEPAGIHYGLGVDATF